LALAFSLKKYWEWDFHTTFNSDHDFKNTRVIPNRSINGLAKKCTFGKMKITKDKISRLINEKVVRVGLTKGHNDYQKFVIFSNYRCGSNYLMNLLKSHSNVVCFSEVFYLDQIYWASKIYGGKVNDGRLMIERDKDERSFLENHIYRSYSKNIKAVGFKLHYKDMHRHEMRILKDYLTEHPETKVIHLKRNNHLDRYISTIITDKTNTAVMVDESSYKKKIENMGQLTLDPVICGKEFTWREGEHNTFEQLLTDLNANVLKITYTDLTKENKKTMDEVAKFLNLKPIELSTEQKKQNKKQKKDIIANYAELKTHFKDSEWSYLFNE